MSDMTVQEFVEKLVKEKAFRKEVVNHCYDVEPPEGDKHGMGKWLSVGAERMGYDFDPVELHEKMRAEVKKLGVFKQIAFAGSLVNTANKAKKAAAAGK